MAADGVPGTECNPDLNSWSVPELQAKLAEIGAPVMGPREELMDRLKSYMMQVWQSDAMGIRPKIPQALEKILQLKEIRQEQLIAAPTGEDDVADTDMNSSRPYSDDEEET